MHGFRLTTTRGGHVRWAILAGFCAAGLLLSAGDQASAKRISGTKKADKISGTKKADKISARGGKDRVKGLKGNDKLMGQGGADRLNGGKGKDTLSGGGSRDQLGAADRKRDRSVNGGAGNDRCVIDQVDLAVMRSCEQFKVGSGAGGAGGAAGGDTKPGELPVTSGSGLSCDQQLPLCPFQIEGTGADEAVGTVTGGGEVTIAGGGAVAPQGEDWTAAGTYGCTGPGFLRVTIAQESVSVPITCTTSS